MNYMQIQQVSYSIVQEKTLFVGVRAEILLFQGFVQKYYCPELLSLQSLVQGPFQGLCRNISFWEKYSPLHAVPAPVQGVLTELCLSVADRKISSNSATGSCHKFQMCLPITGHCASGSGCNLQSLQGLILASDANIHFRNPCVLSFVIQQSFDQLGVPPPVIHRRMILRQEKRCRFPKD